MNVSPDRIVTDYVFDTARVHDSQHIERRNDRTVVTLTVMPTYELLQWLQAHAGELTLCKPDHIRASVQHQLEAALARQTG